jgi:hypothetical protein
VSAKLSEEVAQFVKDKASSMENRAMVKTMNTRTAQPNIGNTRADFGLVLDSPSPAIENPESALLLLRLEARNG